jgi:uncharacterized protein
MHPQLEVLLQIQDLKSQRRELGEHEREVEEQEFHIDIDEALAQLETRITELEEELPPAVRGRIRRYAQSAGARVVVPVINGICYGCFSALPTATMSDIERNDRLNHCEQCGRYLYVAAG